MIMAELDHLSWREKLKILRNMPKPGVHNQKHLHNVLVQSSSKTYKKPTADEYMRMKLLEYSEKYRKDRSYGHATPVPDCLNTFSDFFNPHVSAEERFDKYLLETERLPRDKSKKPRQMQLKFSDASSNASAIITPRKIVLGDLLYTDNHNKDESDENGTVVTDSKYRPGSKGGGWKVLPQISVGTTFSGDRQEEEDGYGLTLAMTKAANKKSRSHYSGSQCSSASNSSKCVVMPSIT